MKQSTKLLSIIMAVMMLVSVVSVAGNAALVKNQVAYNSIDNADLTAEQVADLAMDAVDNLLKDMDTIDLSILGELRLNSLDNICEDITRLTSGFVWAIGKGLLGDVGDFDFSAINAPLKRSSGDVNEIYHLLQLLSDNKAIISKVAYGIGTSNGISLGLIGNFLKLPSNITDLLNDIPGYLTKLVFGKLLYGTYAYQGDQYDPDSGDWAGLPAGCTTIDDQLNTLIYNYLTKPVEKKTNPDGTITWSDGTNGTLDSTVSKQFAALNPTTAKGLINLNNNSLLTIVDNVLQIAFNEFGVPGLNHSVKHLLMDVMGADAIELTKTFTTDSRYAAAYADYEAVAADVESNYLVKDYVWNTNGVWYFTDWEKRTVFDLDGNPVLDEDGKEVQQKQRTFYKFVTGDANEFFNLVDWTYEFAEDEINTADLVTDYGSIFGSLNHLIYVVLEKCINYDVVDPTTLWEDGDNTMLNENLLRTAKWVLENYTKTIFGKDSAYVDAATGEATAEFVANIEAGDLIDIAAYIGLPLFEKYAMPQIIFPKNADGSYAFDDGLQVVEFGAIVIRELITDICPSVNYDSYIFADGTLTSATGRKFASHTSEEWFNIILNMGIDLGYFYLNGVTNFNKATPATDITKDRWMGMLDDVVTWGADYIGGNSTINDKATGSPKTATSGLLVGYTPATFNGKADAIDKLNYALNRLLPLGFISDCGSSNYDVDLNIVIDKIKDLALTFNLEGIVALFGRNTAAADKQNPNSVNMGNILTKTNVITTVLQLAQRILYLVAGSNLLPNTQKVSTLLTQANLKTVVQNLLGQLYSRRTDIVLNVLPIVSQFVKDWGGEQKFGTPDISVGDTIGCSNGALGDSTITVYNGAKGVWRSYKDAGGTRHQDNQYKYQMKAVGAYNYNGSNSSYMTIKSFESAAMDYGESKTITYNVNNVPATGAIVRLDVKYVVYDEDGALMADGTQFTASKYVMLSYNPSQDQVELYDTGKGDQDTRAKLYGQFYVDNTNVGAIDGAQTWYLSKSKAKVPAFASAKEVSATTGSTATQAGLTYPTKTIKSKSADESESGNLAIANKANLQTAADNAVANKSANPIATWNVRAYAQGAGEQTLAIKVFAYDGDYRSKLQSLVNSEASKMRKAAEYNTTGTVLADSVLDPTENADGLKETNFSTTDFNENGDEVTVIDRAAAWSTYTSAFQAAFLVSRQLWNANAKFDFETPYKALYTAAKDVEYLKMTAAELAAAGGANVDNDVEDLRALLDSTNATIAGKNQTDYAFHRWTRLTDSRDDAAWIIGAKDAAAPTVAPLQFYPYAGYTTAAVDALIAGNPYEAYIKATYKDYSADEYKQQEAALKAAKDTYAGIQKIDVAQAENLLTRNTARLLPTAYGSNAELAFLNAEIASANAQIGTAQGDYTARSWARYTAALAAAQAAVATGANKAQFDAKYELMVARNQLRTAEEEADYTELEALMAQAQAVLNNAASYSNGNADFGRLVAALGLEAFTDAKGNPQQIFPDAAYIINGRSYAVDDQRSVDRAADALRAALAKMTLIDTGTGVATVVAEATPTVIGQDADENDIIVDIAILDPKTTVDNTKAHFTSVTCDDKIVSLNETYAISIDDNGAFTGTGSTVTFYKNVGGVNIPIATVSIVVQADVNGDGILDSMDARTVKLTVQKRADLIGLFFQAANLDTSDEEITVTDFSAVANRVVASA